MKKTTLLFIFLSLGCLLSQAQNALLDAEKLYKEGKIKKALELVNSDISKNGENEKNACLKSKILFYVNADEAWQNVQQTIRKFPNQSRPYYVRANFYFELRQMQNSINDFNKALELCNDDSLRYDIYIGRSGVFHHGNQIQNSISDCEEALKIRPNSIDALNNLAGSKFDEGKVDEAEKILLKMKDIDSKYLGVYINLGYQMQQVGNYEKAKKYLLEGLQVDEKNAYINNNLGYTEFKLGNLEQALTYINKSLKIDPSNSYAYRNLALIYLSKNDKQSACENIKKSLVLKFTDMYGAEMEELRQKYCL